MDKQDFDQVLPTQHKDLCPRVNVWTHAFGPGFTIQFLVSIDFLLSMIHRLMAMTYHRV